MYTLSLAVNLLKYTASKIWFCDCCDI